MTAIERHRKTQQLPRHKPHKTRAKRVRKLDATQAFDLIKDYARQELLQPLAEIPRWLALGLAGTMALIVGLFLLLLSLLRALQTETGTAFAGNLSWIPYVISVVALAVLITALVREINKRSL